MRYRFIGDPAERAEGREITPGPWLDMPADETAARKIRQNKHYEVEGETVAPAAPKRPVKRGAGKPKLAKPDDAWLDEDEAE